MPLVSSIILPHGAMTLDGGAAAGCSAAAVDRLHNLPETLKEDCQTLFKACHEAAEIAKTTKPDVIFLNTPHGICLSNSHAVYINTKAKGNAEWNKQWTEYDVFVDLDVELAKSFAAHLIQDAIPAEEMKAFSSCEAPLRWGEVIPLWFVRDLTASGVKVVIFSNPLSRSRQFSLTDITKVGDSIAKFFDRLEQRVLYIVSGDLAHSHQTECTMPLYLADPRWNMPTSDTALPFDICVENWVKGIPYSPESKKRQTKTKEKHSSSWDSAACSNAQKWISEAVDLKQEALSCGIYGFCLLQGILANGLKKRNNFTAHLLCRLAPTYYGMAAAVFL
ncbi:uncharacterized protein LOC135341516 [Halichondria panicea]|uniref:uncharacterized protein LOC135341516 n=1 Tax=Halichondria panicea TaxID=6063 RepID=UPI00312BA770